MEISDNLLEAKGVDGQIAFLVDKKYPEVLAAVETGDVPFAVKITKRTLDLLESLPEASAVEIMSELLRGEGYAVEILAPETEPATPV